MSVVVPLLEAVLGSRIIKTIGEQRRPENKGDSAAGGLNIAVAHRQFLLEMIPTFLLDRSRLLYSSMRFVRFAIVLKHLSYDCTFCIILSLKYMRTLTFLIVNNITLNPEHV